MLDAMISSGLRIAEMGYPLGLGRFTPATGVPLICHYVLPMLTSDLDRRYDTLAEQVPAWPRAWTGRCRWSPARPCPSASPAWSSRRTTPGS
jgi:hypothetical protein